MNIQNFRIISILEGISFLLILAITMPLKYFFENPEPNKFIGMVHGILFILYVVMAISLQRKQNWSIGTLAVVLACSVIPFGTFWMDKKYLRA